MVDISYLLPTNRVKTHLEILQQAIDSVNNQSTQLEYEILIYSEEEVKGKNIRWIEEDKRRGPIYGINLLAKKFAKGNYFVVLTDDQQMRSPIDLCINMIESNIFENRKFKICGLGCGGSCRLPPRGTRIGHVMSLQEDWPHANLLRWPVVRRDTLDDLLNGFIFHPDLFHGAGDIWLGYYLAMNNEPCIEGPTEITPIHNLHDSTFERQDSNTVYALTKNFQNGDYAYVNMNLYKEYQTAHPEMGFNGPEITGRFE